MSKSGTSRNSISPPSGSGRLSGMGEAFSLDLNSGQCTYTLPFELPKGVAGFKPRIKLLYSHGQANGPFGLGWRLQIRQINRRLDYGIPNEEMKPVFMDGTLPLHNWGDGKYHPQREMGFSTYQKVGDGWAVTEKDGRRQYFGESINARIVDPDHPDRVQSWLLEREEDLNGNTINYEYSRIDGYQYLSAVRYATFRVVFEYEARPDVVFNGRAGFFRRITQRCKSISLYLSTTNQKVRALNLEYTHDDLSGVSLLTGAQLSGHKPGKPDIAKAPISFSYYRFDPKQFEIRWQEPENDNSSPPSFEDPDTVLIAMEDLPLPGILVNRNGRHYYWGTDGNGNWKSPRILGNAPFGNSFIHDGVQFVDMDASGSADMLVGLNNNPLNGFYENRGSKGWGDFIFYPRQSRALPPFFSGRIRLGDLNGNGVIDALYSTDRGLVSYQNHGKDGWTAPTVSTNDTRANFSDRNTFLADITGDGMPDLVQVQSGRIVYAPNLGYGKFGNLIPMENSPRLDEFNLSPNELFFLDVNGNGCSDMVRVSAKGVVLYINRCGTGFADPVVYDIIPPPIPGTVRIVDLDGRGKAGILYNSMRNGQNAYVYFSWNQEVPSFMIRSLSNGRGMNTQIRYETVVEMARKDRESGRLWDTYMPFPLWVVSKMEETDELRGRTSVSEYRYHDGHFNTRFRQFKGFREVEKLVKGDSSRADVLTKYQFLMDQVAQPGATPDHVHLDSLMSRVEVYSLDGSPSEKLPYHIETTEYDFDILEADTSGNHRVFVYIKSTEKQYIERSSDKRTEVRHYDYDNYGNVVQELYHGYGMKNGNPVPEKKLITEINYASDRENRIFKVSQLVKRDDNNQILAEFRTFYDGAGYIGLPLGQLSKGLEVRNESLLMILADYNAHYDGMDMSSLGYFVQNDSDGNPAVFSLDKRITYTSTGNIATETTSLGRVSTTSYDVNNLHVIGKSVNGKTSIINPDPVSGKPLSLRGHNGEIVRMEYDAFDRLTHFMIADDSIQNPTRKIEYDDTSLPNSRATSYRVNARQRSETVMYFDGAGKELQKRVQRTPTEVIVSGWAEHNPWMQTAEEYLPTIDNTLAYSKPDLTNQPSTKIQFDGEGRPIRTENFNGGIGTVEIKPFELIIADANDNNAQHLHQNTPRREEVDVWNHRTAIIEEGSNGQFVNTRFKVGLFGELLELSDDHGVVATYTYDSLGNRLSIDHRDAGRRLQWFDSHRDIIRTLNAKGDDISVERDTEGRLIQVNLAGNTVEQFSYDDTAPGVDGRLVEAEYESGFQKYFYDVRGRVIQHSIIVDNNTFDLQYEHNDMGRQIAVIYPDGTRVEKQYYLNGMLKSITGIIDEILYDANNHPTTIRYPNGLITQIAYEVGRGRIKSQLTTGPGGAVYENVQYTYDQLQQLIGVQDNTPGRIQQLNYEYDSLSQLSNITGVDQQGNVSMNYTYTNGYNLSHNAESEWQMVYGDAARPDRLTEIQHQGQSISTVQYDLNGNMLNLPDRQLEYGFKNELRKVTLANGTVVEYDYDFRGNRIRRRETKAGTTTETIYIGRMVEFTNGNFLNYVIMNYQRIALIRQGITRWIHNDQLGSANFFSDENGTKIADTCYYPYGRLKSQSGLAPTRTFALHEYDTTTGLYNMGRRWYAPEIGRFITPDPLYLYQPERSDGHTKSLRLYTYVGNDPLNNVDPTGLSFWSVLGAIVGVIVGVVLVVAVIAAFATGIGFGLLAVAGVIGLMTVSYVIAHDNMGSALGEFFRGFMIGMNAGMNATILAMFGPVGVVLGVVVGVINFLAAFDGVAANPIYQGIMGWSNWLMPMSWLVTGLGLIFFVLNGLGHLLFWEIPSWFGGGIQFFRIEGLRMNWSTGMLATRGGWISNLNTIDTAFNMGNFAYVDSNSFDAAGNPDWHMNHEAGHTLNLAAFGSVFHFIGFIHEMGMSAGAGAFSEELAESNAGPSSVPMWS